MSSCLISSPNFADRVASVYGGTWLATLPVTNLLDRRLKKVARSNGITLAATQFTVDAGTLLSMGVLALSNHNAGVAARYRVTMSNMADLSSPLYDSGWLDWWPGATLPFGSLPWGEFDFHGRPVGAEQLSYTPKVLIHKLPAQIRARYTRFEIDDQANSDGYVQLGRLFIGLGWVPVVNMDYGAGIGYESRSKSQEAFGGAEYFDIQQSYRVARFNLAYMSESEAMAQALRIQAQADIHGEVLYMWDAEDTVYRLQRSFVGRLRNLNMIEHPNFDTWRTGYEIKELI